MKPIDLPQPMVRRDLFGMNSEIVLIACGGGAGRRLDRAETWLRAFEDRFSRFRVLSELSRLNRSNGAAFRASPALLTLTRLSLDLAFRSAGLFDPTVLNALKATGYDRSFELLDPAHRTSRRLTKTTSWRNVRLDASERTIQLPPGAGLDFGGFGKGWAADRVAKILGRPSLVNLGGDVMASGRPPGEDVWPVGIASPFEAATDIALLGVEDRAIATSSSLRRAWGDGEDRAHHLIDTRTQRPSNSDIVQATVVAQSATEADFQAKWTLLLGSESALAHLNDDDSIEGLLVTLDGRRLESRGWSAVLADRALQTHGA